MEYRHIPALCDEVIRVLDPRPGQIVVDATFGGGGHARLLSDQLGPSGLLIALDQDPDAQARFQEVHSSFTSQTLFFRENFRHTARVLAGADVACVHRILLDIGLSQHHINASGRGFGFSAPEPLDMRMNPDAATTAADILATAPERELADLFFRYGEERHSRAIARRIVAERAARPLETADELGRLVAAVAGKRQKRPERIHPATRVFQALRIAVNDELGALADFLAGFDRLLCPGGRVAVLSWHSLEDRLVKRRFAELAKGCTCPPDFPVCRCGKQPAGRVVTKKPITASDREVAANPMARSARLRAFEMAR